MTQAQQPHLEPIGYLRGRPIWPIMGGDGTDDGAGAGAGTGGTQAGGTSSGQGAAPEDGQGAAGSSSSGGEGTDETAEQRVARLERENRELRGENAERRRKAAAAEQAAEQARQAGLTEAERTAERQRALEEENGTLRNQLREHALSTAALTAAAKLNFRNPELAVRLLDRGAVEWSEDGQPKGVEAQLRKLAEADTYLVKGAGADYGGGNRGQGTSTEPGMNELLSTVLRRQ